MILNTEGENWEAEWDGEHAQYAHGMQLEDARIPEQMGHFYEFHSSVVAKMSRHRRVSCQGLQSDILSPPVC